jgi:transcription factor IIIB 90 kDa subunit
LVVLVATNIVALPAPPTVTKEQQSSALADIPHNWKSVYPKGNNGLKLVLPDESTAEERKPSLLPTEAKLDMTEWQNSLPDFIEDEISDMFRTDEEAQEKEVIFNKMNKEYIAKQSLKQAEKTAAAAASKGLEETDLAQAEGQARYKQRKKQSKKEALAAATTTEEQLKATIASRRVSRKINYDALSSIFDDDGGFDTNMDPEDPGDEDGMEEELI